ncbi:MAG: GntR domain protein [Frankiales bacterium]|nr:GntR domain protein [Frankiales bacterium]
MKVVSVLAEMILTGQLAAGAFVREAEFADRLAVSRTPVREAIAQLVARGLLSKEDGRSARVHQPSLTDLLEIYELRGLTETYLAQRAATARNPVTVARLENLEAKLRTSTGDEWFEHHAAFHQTILEGADRPRFTAIAGDLKYQSEPYVRLATKLDESLQSRSADEHSQLLSAMQTGDATAAGRITEAHLRSTVDSVERIFRASRGLLIPLGGSVAHSTPQGGR